MDCDILQIYAIFNDDLSNQYITFYDTTDTESIHVYSYKLSKTFMFLLQNIPS